MVKKFTRRKHRLRFHGKRPMGVKSTFLKPWWGGYKHISTPGEKLISSPKSKTKSKSKTRKSKSKSKNKFKWF